MNNTKDNTSAYEVTMVNWSNRTSKKIYFGSIQELMAEAGKKCVVNSEDELFTKLVENCFEPYETYNASGCTRIVRLSDGKSWPPASALIESSYVVVILDMKMSTHETRFYATTKEFIVALSDYCRAWRDEYKEGESQITPFSDQELHYLLNALVEEDYDSIYEHCGSGWASVVITKTGEIYGEEGRRPSI